MAGDRETRLRCFVGTWPDAIAAGRLQALASELHRELPRARCVPRANLHLTLAFIGDLTSDRARRLAAEVASIAIAPFDWSIDRLGAFDGPRVVWAGGRTPDALARLVQQVETLLTAHRVPFDRRPYRPHVTLLRHVPPGGLGGERPIDPPIPWQVNPPLLLHSASGGYLAVEPGA